MKLCLMRCVYDTIYFLKKGIKNIPVKISIIDRYNKL